MTESCHALCAAVLQLDDNYCFVNKPADVCIDGDRDVTLIGLVTKELEEHLQRHPEYRLRHCHQVSLYTAEIVHKRTTLLQPSHTQPQLDLITSGVLCYALTKKAAAAASRAFGRRCDSVFVRTSHTNSRINSEPLLLYCREARKSYLALVYGHMPRDHYTFDSPMEKDPTDPRNFQQVCSYLPVSFCN